MNCFYLHAKQKNKKKGSPISVFCSANFNCNFHFEEHSSRTRDEEYSSLLSMLSNHSVNPAQSDTKPWFLTSTGILSVSSFFAGLSTSDQNAFLSLIGRFSSLLSLAKHRASFGRWHRGSLHQNMLIVRKALELMISSLSTIIFWKLWS